MPADELSLTGNPSDPEERGKLIGIGGQFTVHDIGNGRVMKIPNSMDGSRRFVGGWGPHVLDMKRHQPVEQTALFRYVNIPHVLRLAARYPILSDALARPLVAPGACFTQDKVRPLRELLPTAAPEEIRGYLDGCADVCQLCWRYGIHDYLRFFGVNNAIDAQGTVVLVDFGETAFDMAWVAGNVKSCPWETNGDLIEATFASEYLEHHFQAITNRLSGKNFELHWAADLDDLDRKIIEGPQLSERLEDVPSLVEPILKRANREEGWSIEGVSAEGMDFIAGHSWWNGVEFQNALYRAAESCRGTTIQLDDLTRYVQQDEST